MAQFQALPQEVRTAALKEALKSNNSIKPKSISTDTYAYLVIGAITGAVGFTVINALIYIVGLFA